MTDEHLKTLSEVATDAHTRIQENFANINPVVGVNRKLRASGIPADAMTIDCLKTSKRIIIILHDHEPEIVRYQMSFIKEDPSDDYVIVSFPEFTADFLYGLIKDYFQGN